MLNVGLDMDGTITAFPGEFKEYVDYVRETGGKAYLVTFRMESFTQVTAQELKSFGINVDGMYHWDSDKYWTLGPGEYKYKIAKKLKLNVMIDDDPSVLRAMPYGVRVYPAEAAARMIREGRYKL